MRNPPSAFRLPPFGFTMVEVLIVVAIMALLVSVLVGVAGRIDDQRNTTLTENCLDILDAALREFREITGHYPVDDWGDIDTTSLIYNANAPGVPPESDELLYLQLSILPQTREIISKLPNQLITAPQSDATVQLLDNPTADTPYLQSIVDAWGNVLVYTRDSAHPNDVFPTITSDGPDGPNNSHGGDGDTVDDIDNAD